MTKKLRYHEVEKEIEFICPVRGKVVQKVMVKVLEPQKIPEQMTNSGLSLLLGDEEEDVEP